MCRLYTFRSNYRRKIECELIRAENSLLTQSVRDAEGRIHSDGWGLAHYTSVGPHIVRNATAAISGEEFRWAAAEAYSTNVLAHVRSATVGSRLGVNTHPFHVGNWLLAHNGTIATFPLIRERMIADMTPEFQRLSRGTTDSEHVFHLILSALQRDPAMDPANAVRSTVRTVEGWARDADPNAEYAVNLVLTNGPLSVVLRYGRTLWLVQRTQVHACQVCAGTLHVDGLPPNDYRAVAFASEQITTDENWMPVDEGSLYTITSSLEVTRDEL